MELKFILSIFFIVLQISVLSGQVTDKEYALMPPVFELDNFDRCMLLGDEAIYCTIEFQMEPVYPNNTSKVWEIMKTVSSNPKNYRHDLLRHGICIPFTCPNISSTNTESLEFQNDLAECYNKKYVDMQIYGKITNLHCQTNEPLPVDSYDVLVGAFLVGYIIFVIFASFYEGLARYKTQKEYEKITGTPYGKFISSFSIPKNWYRLKTVKDTPDVNSLRCIQGVRFYNMMCVIMAHTVMLALIGPVANTKFTETMTEKFLNMFLASGAYAVQTFFIISGWLLTYHFLTTFEGKKDIKLRYFVWSFINRYIRLTATLGVLLLIHSTWMIHAGKGPYWDHIVGEEYRNCRQNAWTNLLYINIYVNPQNMCYTESWYLSTDTQFFILQLVLIYFILKYPKRVWWILGSCLTIHIALLMTIIYIGKYPITLRPYPEVVLFLDILKEPLWIILVASPFANASGGIIGVALGYIYYKTKNINIHASKVRVFLWWILSFGFPLGIIILPGLRIHSNDYQSNQLFTILYVGLGRTIFGIGISCMMYGCTKGFGWMAKWTLECAPTYVLGRLTYSAFLIHYILMIIISGQIRTPYFVSDTLVINLFVGQLALSYIAGLFLALLFEIPISQLQSAFVPQREISEKSSEKEKIGKKKT